MGVPHITAFCWCMGLEVGSKCVGFLHLLASLVLVLICSLLAEDARGVMGTVEDAGDGLYASWFRIFVIAAAMSVVHVLLAATLLFSVFKRAPTGLRVWVCIMSVLFAAALVSVVVACAARGLNGSGSDIFLSFLEGLLFFGVIAYAILCVNSYYLMLKSSEDMEGPNKYDY